MSKLSPLWAAFGLGLILAALVGWWRIQSAQDFKVYNTYTSRSSFEPQVILKWSESSASELMNTGIYYDGPNHFAVQKEGRKIWSGTPEEFIALVERGVSCK